jgi:hypothetical protein
MEFFAKILTPSAKNMALSLVNDSKGSTPIEDPRL